jgi:hypothetical protein
MPATRTYQITADDLKRLHGFAEESIATLVCVRGDPPCGMVEECERCKANKNLLDMLADAVILSAAGAEIVITTAESVEKQKTEGTVH